MIQHPKAPRFLHRLYGRTRQDIVEFTKQGFLGFLQFLLRIGRSPLRAAWDSHFFPRQKAYLPPPVLLLHPDLRGIAAYRPGIQIPVPPLGSSLPAALRGFTSLRKISLRRGMNQIPFAGALTSAPSVPQIHPGRTAAVVSHTPEHTACQRLLFFRLPFLGIHPLFHLLSASPIRVPYVSALWAMISSRQSPPR